MSSNIFKLFAYWVILYFCRLPIFPPKSTSLKILSEKNTRVPNSLDPDQVRTFVGPDLGPGCFKQLSMDDTSRQKKVWKCVGKYWVVCQATIWLQEPWCACVVVCTEVDQGRHKQVWKVESWMFSSKLDKSCHLYISTNAYVVCAQKNRLNLRERERGRERGREREEDIITGQVVTISANVLNKTVYFQSP